MNFTKKIFATALLASTIFMTGCGQMNIGYVDGEKVESAPQLQAIINEGEQKLQELQAEAAKELEGKEGEELTNLQSTYQRRAQGIQQAYSTQLRQKLDSVLAEISETKKLDVVVESSKDNPTVFLGGIDVTEEVVQKLQ